MREVACHRAAAAAGAAPAVLDAAPDCSWILVDYVEGGIWTPPCRDGHRIERPEALRGRYRVQALEMGAQGAQALGQAQAIFERDPAAAAQVNALLARTRQLAVDCAAFAVTPVITHGDLNASNLIGSVPMLVDWE